MSELLQGNDNNAWNRYLLAIASGDPEEALAILERDGHLMAENKPKAEEVAKTLKKPRKVKIPQQDLMEAALRDDNSGFCLACGAENYGIEADGSGGECEECGERKVVGAARLLGIV